MPPTETNIRVATSGEGEFHIWYPPKSNHQSVVSLCEGVRVTSLSIDTDEAHAYFDSLDDVLDRATTDVCSACVYELVSAKAALSPSDAFDALAQPMVDMSAWMGDPQSSGDASVHLYEAGTENRDVLDGDVHAACTYDMTEEETSGQIGLVDASEVDETPAHLAAELGGALCGSCLDKAIADHRYPCWTNDAADARGETMEQNEGLGALFG